MKSVGMISSFAILALTCFAVSELARSVVMLLEDEDDGNEVKIWNASEVLTGGGWWMIYWFLSLTYPWSLILRWRCPSSPSLVVNSFVYCPYLVILRPVSLVLVVFVFSAFCGFSLGGLSLLIYLIQIQKHFLRRF